jgi:hypothetical protein
LNFGQTIWDKNEVLLGMSSRTTQELEEPQENMMRTIWTQKKNSSKKNALLYFLHSKTFCGSTIFHTGGESQGLLFLFYDVAKLAIIHSKI